MPRAKRKPETKASCRVAGCKRRAATLKHRLCWGHYKRYLKTGEVGATPLRSLRTIPAYTP